MKLKNKKEKYLKIEPPKTYYFISEDGDIWCDEDIDGILDIKRKRIGNYFKSEKEVNKAYEKLLAWKRLKDRGLRIDDWYVYPKFGYIYVIFKINDINDVVDILKKGERDEDLDLIFGENHGETDS